MNKSSLAKKDRHNRLLEKIKEDPFMTDEEIAEYLDVSIPTVRLDRLELGIPELRKRIRDVASLNHQKVRALHADEIVGELVEIQLGVSGISILDTTDQMVFSQSKIVRGHYIYSLAESLAIAVIDAEVALVGVANIKYKTPVYAGSRLVAKAVVRQIRQRSHIVWVFIYFKQKEVFRGKFILVSIEDNETLVSNRE
ncbi:MAG: transcription factor FapR [Clostridiaceae bacterium]|nr:transcription factor FapR [Clostridiaceae bacterium]